MALRTRLDTDTDISKYVRNLRSRGGAGSTASRGDASGVARDDRLRGGRSNGGGDGDGRVGDGGDASGHGDDGDASRGLLGLLRNNRGAGGRLSRGDSDAAAAAGSLRGDGNAGLDGGGAGRLSRGLSLSGVARAVGHGGSARGDGDVLGRVDGLDVTSNGEAGKEGNGSSGETHFD